MELNIGDYVRTLNGKIWVIKSPQAISGHKKDIVNSSLNILELLEPMDLIYVDIDNGLEGGITVPRIAETRAELDLMINLIKSGQWVLKSVITHEQLYNIKYDIGK